jgi:hypothetical protein|tara:strand:+ start:142 stop:555 length:414 start_codon:yes stop_codon:yes gene_type:complete
MKLFGMSVNLGKCVLAFFLIAVMFNIAIASCSFFHEGFGNKYGSDLEYKMGEGIVLGGGGKAWDMRNLKGQGPRGETEKGYKIPVKKMDVFDGVRFAPECCPSTYSNSVGCACAPGNLERYVAEQRGGNNTKNCGSF